MEIIYRKGDLLETDCRLIAHGCNAQGVMGSGVAKAIRAKYPNAYDIYRGVHLDKGLTLGENVLAGIPGTTTIIVNCITQEFYGRDSSRIYIDYKSIRSCMRNLNTILEMYDEVAMPKIGAGLGGGDWETISIIIEEELTDLQPIVYEL